MESLTSVVKETGGITWSLMACLSELPRMLNLQLRAGPSLLLALIDGKTRPSHLASN
jgi:hypothetical protein